MIQTHVPQQTVSKSGDKRRNREAEIDKWMTRREGSSGRLGLSGILLFLFLSVHKVKSHCCLAYESHVKPRSARKRQSVLCRLWKHTSVFKSCKTHPLFSVSTSIIQYVINMQKCCWEFRQYSSLTHSIHTTEYPWVTHNVVLYYSGFVFLHLSSTFVFRGIKGPRVNGLCSSWSFNFWKM